MSTSHWFPDGYNPSWPGRPVVATQTFLYHSQPYPSPTNPYPSAERPPTPVGPSHSQVHTLRRTQRQQFHPSISFTPMYGSRGDEYNSGLEQGAHSSQRPSNRSGPEDGRPASRQGHYEETMRRPERPESRNHHYNLRERPQHQATRPESRQSQVPPPVTQARQDQPESSRNHHRTSHSRPPSRQDYHARRSSAQFPAQERPPSRSQRPPSRQDTSEPAPQHRARRMSERQHSHHNDVEGRAFRKAIADSTIAAINNGIEGVDVRNTQRYTKLYHDDDKDLVNWRRPPRTFFGGPSPKLEVNIVPISTLEGARFLAESLQQQHQTPSSRASKIGVLNFASATLPGGGFLTGARAQEESLARSSTLYVALTTPAARPFYALHAADDRRGFYTHSMIYAPDVHLFRDDAGGWLPALAVDVLTSPAVNAGQVRRQGRSAPAKLEARIQEAMHERMGRILALFEKKKVRNLVLGSFGTGVFQNDVRAMAGIWYELLQEPGARFAGSFDHVIFAIPDDSTAKQFSAGFRNKTAARNE